MDNGKTNETFAAIDAHALKAPSSVRYSVASLAQYLVRPARNELEDIRAIYRWITDNISYDADGYFSGHYGFQDADAVLQRGSGVCAGYARLFSALCNVVEIQNKKVPGFAKGFNYDPEVPFTQNMTADHAWNIVFVNGEWRLIDSKWGAGHINSYNQYEKSFDEFYFLSNPKDFVKNHFPLFDDGNDADPSLQLLKHPWSLEKFNKACCPNSHGLKLGFESVSHNTQVITFNKECEITFRTRKAALQSVLCHLTERTTRINYDKYVLLRKMGDKFTAQVTPPAKGKKLRRVMINKNVHNKGGNGEFDITFETCGKGYSVTFYGSPNENGKMDGLYKFNVL